MVLLELVRGRADPDSCSCESQAGVPSTALFWESKMRGQKGRQARPGGGDEGAGQRWADDPGPWRGRSRASGRALREGGTAFWRQAALLHTFVKGRHDFPVGGSGLPSCEETQASAFIPSDEFSLIPGRSALLPAAP